MCKSSIEMLKVWIKINKLWLILTPKYSLFILKYLDSIKLLKLLAHHMVSQIIMDTPCIIQIFSERRQTPIYFYQILCTKYNYSICKKINLVSWNINTPAPLLHFGVTLTKWKLLFQLLKMELFKYMTRGLLNNMTN